MKAAGWRMQLLAVLHSPPPVTMLLSRQALSFLQKIL